VISFWRKRSGVVQNTDRSGLVLYDVMRQLRTFPPSARNWQVRPSPAIRDRASGMVWSTRKRTSVPGFWTTSPSMGGRINSDGGGMLLAPSGALSSANDLGVKGRAAVARLAILRWGGAKRACPSGRA
jgi:hypothetical protein